MQWPVPSGHTSLAEYQYLYRGRPKEHHGQFDLPHGVYLFFVIQQNIFFYTCKGLAYWAILYSYHWKCTWSWKMYLVIFIFIRSRHVKHASFCKLVSIGLVHHFCIKSAWYSLAVCWHECWNVQKLVKWHAKTWYLLSFPLHVCVSVSISLREMFGNYKKNKK